MGTSSSGQLTELDAKFLESSEQTVTLWLFLAKKKITILHDQEFTGNWRDRVAGDLFPIKVSSNYAAQQELLGTHTYGSGAAGKGGGSSIPGMGGQVNG